MESLVERALTRVLEVDPDEYRRAVEDLRAAHPDESDDELAQRIIAGFARKGAAEGFASGVAANPLRALPSAVVDVGLMLRFYARLTATLGALLDPDYFERPGWQKEALLALVGKKATARVLHQVAVGGARRASGALVEKVLSRDALVVVEKLVLRWSGRKVGQRALFAKSAFLLGGVVSAAWNWAEIRLVGRRILGHHRARLGLS